MPEVERLRIWPGVETSHLVQVLRAWIEMSKIQCYATGFKELLSKDFAMSPKLKCMVTYACLAKPIIAMARNGVLSHVQLYKALDEVRRLWHVILKKIVYPQWALLNLLCLTFTKRKFQIPATSSASATHCLQPEVKRAASATPGLQPGVKRAASPKPCLQLAAKATPCLQPAARPPRIACLQPAARPPPIACLQPAARPPPIACLQPAASPPPIACLQVAASPPPIACIEPAATPSCLPEPVLVMPFNQ